MAKMAIIITTKNRKKLAAKCIKSIFNSSYNMIDLYVVDNGSTDGTKEHLVKLFGDKIKCIRLEINKGSAGGYDVGLQEALDIGYDWYALCDDDIVLRKDTIDELVNFMEDNPNVGVVGPKLYRMDTENTLQSFHTYLGWDGDFNLKAEDAGVVDNKDFYDCAINVDYLPACFMLIRKEVAEHIRHINTDYISYFDDIDFCHKARLMGYDIMLDGKAVIWHAMLSVNSKEITTRRDYYWTRSKFSFFLRYTPEKELKNLCSIFLSRLYSVITEKLKCKAEIVKDVIIKGTIDAINDTYTPETEVVLKIPKVKDRIKEVLHKGQTILLDEFTEYSQIHRILKWREEQTIYINCDNIDEIKEKILEFCNKKDEDIVKRIFMYDKNKTYDINIKQVFHVRDVKYDEKYIYMDVFGNYILNHEDADFWSDFYSSRKKFVDLFLSVCIEKAKKLRQKWREEGMYDFLTEEQLKRSNIFDDM